MGKTNAFFSRVTARAEALLGKRLTRWLKPRWLYLLSGRVRPLSSQAGTDRGQPIDRYYIEEFLEANRDLVRGTCLEVKDNEYTTRYGGNKVTRSDVLDVNRDNKQANIHADLRDLSAIPDAVYDCIILTQVLQYIDDMDAAIRECTRVLKSGGALLVTVPSLGKLDGQEDKVFGHYWRLTRDSARYLFGKHFRPENLEISAWGNVLVGLAFWIGLSREELTRRQLAYFDPVYACGVSIRAVKV
jgi:SAM-dependent methyltransferase